MVALFLELLRPNRIVRHDCYVLLHNARNLLFEGLAFHFGCSLQVFDLEGNSARSEATAHRCEAEAGRPVQSGPRCNRVPPARRIREAKPARPGSRDDRSFSEAATPTYPSTG